MSALSPPRSRDVPTSDSSPLTSIVKLHSLKLSEVKSQNLGSQNLLGLEPSRT